MLKPESCLLFSTADWDAPYWTNKQHIAALLGKRGTQVLYIESVGLRAPRVSSGKDWSRLSKRLVTGFRSLLIGPRHVQPNIWVLSPLTIPFKHEHAWVRWFNKSLLQLQIKHFLAVRKLKNPLIWTYHPFLLDVLKGIGVGKLVYHCVDDLSAVPGIDAAAFQAEEVRLLKQANVVFATAPALAEHCEHYNHNTHYLSNVVDAKHFGQALNAGTIPNDLALIPEPRLVYHGVLSDYKIDLQLLLDVASSNSKWSFVFIGEEPEGQRNPLILHLSHLPNVHFLGYRSYEVLPNYLRGMQIGLLPSLINDYTRGMFPMKYYEYLAAGLRVVSTRLAFLSHIKLNAYVADSAKAYANSIQEALHLKKYSIDEIKLIIDCNTWESRLNKMMSILSEKT
jgi:glycosyltransferase involved in cell wall biosynthesis